ncbi:hypothetical protein, partial [Klebsiella quasipneumoniae]|uniref:hypothetical protein n=1 Tax=Klebsiella quasipneumoniae TaxID=1463165 RepID=UPI00272F47B8
VHGQVAVAALTATDQAGVCAGHDAGDVAVGKSIEDSHQLEQNSYTRALQFPISVEPLQKQTESMTYPRSQIAPPDEPGFFHVVSRCV